MENVLTKVRIFTKRLVTQLLTYPVKNSGSILVLFERLRLTSILLVLNLVMVIMIIKYGLVDLYESSRFMRSAYLSIKCFNKTLSDIFPSFEESMLTKTIISN